MSQLLPVNNFDWIEHTPQFNEDFIKNYNEESHEGYYLKLMFNILKKLHELHNDLPFLPQSMKIKKLKSLYLIYMIKLHILYT